jgi:magnesium-transporting ATPase (P-type)
MPASAPGTKELNENTSLLGRAALRESRHHSGCCEHAYCYPAARVSWDHWQQTIFPSGAQTGFIWTTLVCQHNENQSPDEGSNVNCHNDVYAQYIHTVIIYSLCMCPSLFVQFCVLWFFGCGVLLCVMCVICVLCLIVVPLPPAKNPFSVKINNNVRQWASHCYRPLENH